MIPSTLAGWMIRHGISEAAMVDLTRLLTPPVPAPAGTTPRSEAYTQSLIRLEAPRCGVWLGRNNVGALKNDEGRLIRYGLANDSAAMNAQLKSADLIGIRPVLITPSYLGRTIGQFVSRECKPEGWTFTGTPRESAQYNWAMLINGMGGDAKFATGPGTL